MTYAAQFDIAANIADPYPAYAFYRKEAPVHWLDQVQAYATFRYDDCQTILKADNTGLWSHDPLKDPLFAQLQRTDPAQAADTERILKRRFFADFDPPDHTRVRGLVTKAFSKRLIETLRERFAEICEERAHVIAGRDRVDLAEEFAYNMPIRLMAELLGLPVADQERLGPWAIEISSSFKHDAPLESVYRAAIPFYEYLEEQLEDRRKHRRDDLLTWLLDAQESGERLNRDELVSTVGNLVIGGYETTAAGICAGVLAMLRHRAEWDALVENPDLAPNAVEETLRYDGPIHMQRRVALREVQIGDVTLAPGDRVVPMLASANHDGAQYAEPETFDIRREKRPNLAFGTGIHICLGAPLARLEMDEAFRALARIVPRLDLVDDYDYVHQLSNGALRIITELPVRTR